MEKNENNKSKTVLKKEATISPSLKKINREKTNKIALNLVKFYAYMVLLSFIRAFFTYVFLEGNSFAPGGLSGFALLISELIQKTVGVSHPERTMNVAYQLFTNAGFLIFLLNLPLLIPAFILLNKKFAFNTFICVSLFGGMMALFAHLHQIDKFPKFNISANENTVKLLEAIVGGAGAGISLGLMLRSNTSMGGTDIVGKIIYKYNPSADAQWWIFACDCLIVLLAGSFGVIKIKKGVVGIDNQLMEVFSPIIYSFISLIATSKVADIIQSGFQTSIVFHIISSKEEEIADELILNVKRGVTIIHGTGHYSKSERNVLLCVVKRRQINLVKTAILRLDPGAFMYLTKATEVNGGLGFAPLKSNS